MATPAEPTGTIDRRFSDLAAEPTPLPRALEALERAELYWITTVRGDGRPHVTPLIGVMHAGAMHFVSGLSEQKTRNLGHRPLVALTTGTNTWAAGLDVVVEGTAVRVLDTGTLQAIADAFEAKYGSVWHFDVAGSRVSDGGLTDSILRRSSRISTKVMRWPLRALVNVWPS